MNVTWLGSPRNQLGQAPSLVEVVDDAQYLVPDALGQVAANLAQMVWVPGPFLDGGTQTLTALTVEEHRNRGGDGTPVGFPDFPSGAVLLVSGNDVFQFGQTGSLRVLAAPDLATAQGIAVTGSEWGIMLEPPPTVDVPVVPPAPPTAPAAEEKKGRTALVFAALAAAAAYLLLT